MGLQKEIWIPTIVENFYPDNSFSSKSIDDSVYVNEKRVHIPNAGAPSGVEVNRTVKPATIKERTDKDLEYEMDELTTNPIHIPHAETVELSYDKRSSILANDRDELQRVAHERLLERWARGSGLVLRTTGSAITPHTYDRATGKRKAITRDDVLTLMTAFNRDNIPTEGRYLLLDADMYASLLGSLTESDKYAFFASADAQSGILGKLYTFNVLSRSSVLRYKSDGETLLMGGDIHEPTELAAGLAWQTNCVSRALGEVKMFGATDDPTYYGDIYSFLVRTGGSHRRYDKKGIALLMQAATD